MKTASMKTKRTIKAKRNEEQGKLDLRLANQVIENLRRENAEIKRLQ